MATYGLLRGSNLHLRRQGKSIRGWLRSPGQTLLLALAQKPTLVKVPPCLSSRLIPEDDFAFFAIKQRY